MKIKYIVLLLSVLFASCAVSKKSADSDVKLNFLDEYVIAKDLMVDSTQVGGLSGIDYKNGEYYLIVDTSNKARFYKAQIEISNNKIDTVIFTKTTLIDKSADFFKDHPLDPESIRFIPEKKEVVITSEGSIKNEKDPSIFIVDENGKLKSHFAIPAYFNTEGKQKPRHNGVFEGLSLSFNQNGFWVSTELPLKKDGAQPKLFPTRSYTRVTYYNKETLEPEKQFAYKLDGIAKIPWLYFAVNGVTEILEYKQDHFLILERAYSAGHGSYGNTVKIFDVDASLATNTLTAESLRKTDFTPATKKLIFDFKWVQDQLTDGIIDNIEGMCFGPILPDGKRTLILISDNNFNSFAQQLTQVLLFEIEF